MGLCVCMLASMTACGESDSENLTQVSGRVSAVADGEITLSVFEMPGNGEMRGNRPDGVSGGAVDGKERPKMPEGTPPADMNGKMPQGGEMPKDGKMPQGNGQRGQRPDGVSGGTMEGREKPEMPDGTPPVGNAGGVPRGTSETKKIIIKDSTKVYTQQGEEKVESSVSDVQLGSMVMVELDGDEAVSITIQSMNAQGGMSQKSDLGK